MEDKSKGLIRIVNVVLLRIREPKGRILVEAARTRKDGVRTQLDRMPGGKQRSHENAFHTARRIITATLGFSEDIVTFNIASSELLEEEKESPSYPGLKTVYKKHVVDALVGENSGGNA